ncbi:hypothetical protein BDC45DRAFT_247523 [Circinella umbellata]|nr:hypothetical protein BDC45DRAFT_247523 [Circinella umbellata]
MNGSTLHLVPDLYGGSSGSSSLSSSIPMNLTTLFADIVDLTEFDTQRMQDECDYSQIKTGRHVVDGINIEVFCSCTPRHRVIVRHGYGVFDLQETKTPCPNCGSEDVTVITVGFFNCEYKFHGIKYQTFYMLEEWFPTTPGIYHVFDKPRQALWSYLQIESKPIRTNREDIMDNTHPVQDNEEKCTICQENLDSLDHGLVTTLQCNHQFHFQCLTKWRSNTCPNCRAVRQYYQYPPFF